jgi:hypothetical protein
MNFFIDVMNGALPNFLIVGAPKCGTTALYYYLRQHPQIFLPSVKEPYYFVKPKQQIGKGPKDLTWEGMVDCPNAYASLFTGADMRHIAIGEASAGYLHFFRCTIPHIQRELDNPRIIILLRDPVRRAFSSHLHHVRCGREPCDFADAWARQAERLSAGWWFGFQLRALSTYAEGVGAFKAAFANVLVILQEDLYGNRNVTLRKVFSFLGVEEDAEITDLTEKNQNFLPRSLLIDRAKRHLLSRYPGMIASAAEFATSWNLVRPTLRDEVAANYYRYFEDDLESTSAIIRRDLTRWLP